MKKLASQTILFFNEKSLNGRIYPKRSFTKRKKLTTKWSKYEGFYDVLQSNIDKLNGTIVHKYLSSGRIEKIKEKSFKLFENIDHPVSDLSTVRFYAENFKIEDKKLQCDIVWLDENLSLIYSPKHTSYTACITGIVQHDSRVNVKDILGIKAIPISEDAWKNVRK